MNTINEMKNEIEAWTELQIKGKKRISELEDRTVKITHSEEIRRKEWKRGKKVEVTYGMPSKETIANYWISEAKEREKE